MSHNIDGSELEARMARHVAQQQQLLIQQHEHHIQKLNAECDGWRKLLDNANALNAKMSKLIRLMLPSREKGCLCEGCLDEEIAAVEQQLAKGGVFWQCPNCQNLNAQPLVTCASCGVHRP